MIKIKMYGELIKMQSLKETNCWRLTIDTQEIDKDTVADLSVFNGGYIELTISDPNE